MRVWDVHPGYLNRQSLLGEHREIHGMISVLANRKRGYSRHPETVRWMGHLWAARRRHDAIVAEMKLRGYRHQSPVTHRGRPGRWPDKFVDSPSEQFRILRRKYTDREHGRIPLPGRADVLWAQHKYSVLARDPNLYRTIGRKVARLNRGPGFDDLTTELSLILRQPPTTGRLRNALEHMWGYVARNATQTPKSLDDLLRGTIDRAIDQQVTYLLHSTALSDLSLWVLERP